MQAAQAQSAPDITLQKKLQLPAGKLRLDSLSQVVARQTHFRFSINSSKIKASTLISIPSDNTSLEEVLKLLKKQYGVPFAITGNHIILSDRIQDKEVVKKKIIRTEMPVVNHRIVATKPISDIQPVVVNTQLAVLNKRIRPLRIPRRAAVITDDDAGSKKNVLPYLSLYTHLGISADDLMYSNVFAAFGKPWLYATASWGTQYNVSGFRYGIGSAIDLNDEWLIRVELTTGKFQKAAHDTAGFKASVKSKLHRSAFLIEGKLNSNFSLHAGLLLNYLQTKFYMNDVPTTPSRLFQFDGENDSRYITIKPLYTISNNFSPEKETYHQIWIGLQAGVIYRLNF